MNTILYFAYGSNLDEDQMRARCPTSRMSFRARLRNHRLDFTYFSTRWLGGSADVLPHSGESVWGVVYELSPEELNQLDGFERGYVRVSLEVEDDARRRYSVVSYTAREKLTFRPNEIYLQKMLSWGERWKLPDAYLAQLRETPVHRARGPGRLP